MKLHDGYTLMHEHVTLDLSGVKKDKDCHLDCLEETIKEFKELYAYGVRNIVEVTNIGMGRDLAYIQKVQAATGIQIITSTGWYKVPFIEDIYQHMSVKELADIMIKEIELGYENHNTKAGMIGEIGTSQNEWKNIERRVFDAAILAHKKTNCPIYTHTTLSTLAREQATYLVENGVNPKKVVIGHIDLSGDMKMIFDVLKTGVNIGFDTIGKHQYLSDEKRVAMLKEIQDLGFINQVVLSEDLTRKSHLSYLGGIGYSYFFKKFLPMLNEAGIHEASIDAMLLHNPRIILE